MDYWCELHEERVGRRIQAARNVNGTPMCERCFRGYDIGRSDGENRTRAGEKAEGSSSLGMEGFLQWASRRNIAVEAVDSIGDVFKEA
jgi:hypothetical protein